MSDNLSHFERISKWVRANRRRIPLAVLVLYWFFPILTELPYTIIDKTILLSFLSDNRVAFTTCYIVIFSITSAFLLIASWFLYDLIPNVADSLGYSHGAAINLQASGAGHRITLPNFLRPEDKFLTAVSNDYDIINPLSPLDNARFRLLDHITKLRNNSVTNLLVGIGIALIGVGVLFTSLFQLDTFYDQTKHEFRANDFLLIAIAPKLSITLFIQVFAYFFLAMYRSNQGDIRYFHNEITLLDSLATTVVLTRSSDNAANLKIVLTALSKNERNRLMNKSQKTISSTDEAEFMKALSALLDLKLRANHT